VLARKVVALCDKDRLSWLKTEAKLELAPEAESGLVVGVGVLAAGVVAGLGLVALRARHRASAD
jgi:hypothetical protein